MSNLVKIDFHGGEINAVLRDGSIWISVRRVCEHLGIDRNGQQQKLRDAERAPWARGCIMHLHDTSGREQDAFMLHVDSLPMWLATIDTGRVTEQARPLLVAYQLEAAKVLRDHFIYGNYQIPKTLGECLLLAGRIEAEREKLAAENERMRPHAELGEAIVGARGDILIGIFAKMVIIDGRHMGQNRMFKYLREGQVLMSGGSGHNLPYQSYIDFGWFTVHEGIRPGTDNQVAYRTTYVTPLGQERLVNKMKADPAFRKHSIVFKGTEQKQLTIPWEIHTTDVN